MSIKPIDLQALVPRSYEVNRTNSIDAARPETQQQQFVHQLDKEIKREEQSVKQSGKAEKGVVEKDGKHKKQRDDRGSGQRERKNKPATEPPAERTGMSMLDIRV